MSAFCVMGLAEEFTAALPMGRFIVCINPQTCKKRGRSAKWGQSPFRAVRETPTGRVEAGGLVAPWRRSYGAGSVLRARKAGGLLSARWTSGGGS